MNEEREDSISRLNETLNSRTRYRDPLDKRTPVKPLEDVPEVENKWQTPELDSMLKYERTPPPVHPFLKKVFWTALLFFIVTVVVASFVFMGGANFISSKNVDISVLGPTTSSAGAVFELGVSISNTNNADLEFANLSIQYPQGSRNPTNTTESLTYTKDNLGVIKAGAETVRNIPLVLIGSAGEQKEIKFSVEYKVKGSNATFYKDKVFEIVIGDAPITMTVKSPNSVTSGDEFATVVSVKLNATDILKNVVLKAEYPYGYSVLNTTPNSTGDNSIWLLGDLLPGDEKDVVINGRLIGENEEERTFRFYAGVSDSGGLNSNLKIAITSLLNTVAINRPSLGLDVEFNGEETSTYIAPAARTVSTIIKFRNNLPDKLLNPHLELTLSGSALDKSSVRAGNSGTYSPSDSKVVWNLVNNAGNAELTPGSSGQVSLTFNSVPAASLASGNNDIILKFILTGVPVAGFGQVPLVTNETRTVRISSQVNLAAKALRSLGPFANHGPVPPKVGQETSYTVVFSVGNTQGDITDAKITARLGSNVVWLGAPSTGGESIVYDSATRALTWNIGTLASDTGFSSDPRELAFQVSLKPTLGQVGTAPVLVDSIVFSGRDSTSGNTNTVNNPPLTTRLTQDPAFIQGDDIVVK